MLLKVSKIKLPKQKGYNMFDEKRVRNKRVDIDGGVWLKKQFSKQLPRSINRDTSRSSSRPSLEQAEVKEVVTYIKEWNARRKR